MNYIIGNGRVGIAFKELSDETMLFARQDSLEPLKNVKEGDLVIVCTRNDDLQALIDDLPIEALDKLVFVQNGMLSPFIDALSPKPAARAILYFAVATKGEKPVVGAATPVSGPSSELFVSFLEKGGISAKVVKDIELRKIEMEKLLWNSVMGLMGQTYGETVGQTLELRWNEVESIVGELLPVIEADLGIKLVETEILKSMKEYSREVSYYSATVKEWAWRNAWFFEAMDRQSIQAPNWTKLHKDLGLI